MTDQIKKATKSDKRFAIVRASRCLDLAFEFNGWEKNTANFTGDPCCDAIRLAKTTLNVIGWPGDEIIDRAVNCGEYSPKDLSRFIDEIMEEIAHEVLPECKDCGAKMTTDTCTECTRNAEGNVVMVVPA